MAFEGHAAHFEHDAADRMFAGINDVVGFYADTLDGLERPSRAVEDYVATCAAAGREPERTY